VRVKLGLRGSVCYRVRSLFATRLLPSGSFRRFASSRGGARLSARNSNSRAKSALARLFALDISVGETGSKSVQAPVFAGRVSRPDPELIPSGAGRVPSERPTLPAVGLERRPRPDGHTAPSRAARRRCGRAAEPRPKA